MQKNSDLPESSFENVQNLVNVDKNFPLVPTPPLASLCLIGQIEGHILLPSNNKTSKYEHILPFLLNVAENDEIKGLLLVLNTMGGDVEAGLALAEMIASLGKPSVSLVVGGGHSIGVPLAVCCDYSFITPSATMTVHPIRMSGVVIGASSTYNFFRRMQKRITTFVCKHSEIDKSEFDQLLYNTDEISNDTGSLLVGKQAVDYSLINQVGGLSQAINKIYELAKIEKPKKEN